MEVQSDKYIGNNQVVISNYIIYYNYNIRVYYIGASRGLALVGLLFILTKEFIVWDVNLKLCKCYTGSMKFL